MDVWVIVSHCSLPHAEGPGVIGSPSYAAPRQGFSAAYHGYGAVCMLHLLFVLQCVWCVALCMMYLPQSVL